MANRMNQTAVENLKVCELAEIVKHSETAYTIAVYSKDGVCSKIHGADGEIIYKTEELARRAIKRLRSDLRPTLRNMMYGVAQDNVLNTTKPIYIGKKAVFEDAAGNEFELRVHKSGGASISAKAYNFFTSKISIISDYTSRNRDDHRLTLLLDPEIMSHCSFKMMVNPKHQAMLFKFLNESGLTLTKKGVEPDFFEVTKT